MKKFFAMLLALSMALGMTGLAAAAPAAPTVTAAKAATLPPGTRWCGSVCLEPATGDSGAGGKQEMLGMQYANHIIPYGGHRR